MGNHNSVGTVASAAQPRLSVKSLGRKERTPAPAPTKRDSKTLSTRPISRPNSFPVARSMSKSPSEKDPEKETETPQRHKDRMVPLEDLVVVNVSTVPTTPDARPSDKGESHVPPDVVIVLPTRSTGEDQLTPKSTKSISKKQEVGLGRSASVNVAGGKVGVPSITNTPDAESQRMEVHSVACLNTNSSFATSRHSNNSNDSYLKVQNNLSAMKSGGSSTISRTLSRRHQYVSSGSFIMSPMITQAVEDLEKLRTHTPLSSSLFAQTTGSETSNSSGGRARSSNLKDGKLVPPALPPKDVGIASPLAQPPLNEVLSTSLSSFETPTKQLPDIGESIAALAAVAKLKMAQAKKKSERLRNMEAKGKRAGAVGPKERIRGSISVAYETEFHGEAMLHKFNSCSTLFIDSTLTNADLQKTLRCVATALAINIRRNNELNNLHTYDIFSEKLRPLSQHIQFYQRILSEEDIYKFLDCIFQAAELSAECAVITLVYIERMLINTGVTLHSCNWARIVLGSLLLASKVWDDHAVWNIDFCQIFPDIVVKDMNELERWYMSAIQYNVSVKASVYARYYFELRDLLDIDTRVWTSKPLVTPEISQSTAVPTINLEASNNTANEGSGAALTPGNLAVEKGPGIRRSRSFR
ncbi:hypothetical protein HDU98_008028 [Podochytrium sp. JEL0797]|nr:hypothetical protein HDU98_008028 [Podochytrium sp. JEL0797]